jgi:hypothetical protein
LLADHCALELFPKYFEWTMPTHMQLNHDDVFALRDLKVDELRARAAQLGIELTVQHRLKAGIVQHMTTHILARGSSA